jgi:RimJ/RimL family protein N-acetyltransferase
MLTGERVRLRALEPEDAQAIWGWWQDVEFRVLDGHVYPPSLAGMVEWLRSVGDPSFRGLLLGIDIEDGTLIGYTSLKRTVPEDRCAEFGIAIARDYWNQGYGTDTTRTMLRFAFTQMNLHRVSLRLVDDNARARRVYEKCGFTLEGRLREARYHDGRWCDQLVMGILDREFLSAERARSDQ